MIEIEIQTQGLAAFMRKTRRFSKEARQGMEELATDYAEEFKQEVIRNASGRPGPNKVTGDYVNRFRIVKEKVFGGVRVSVVNDHPATARLELGYTGVDSLGRVYNQPPFPHWRPARETVGPKYTQAARDRVPRWWERS